MLSMPARRLSRFALLLVVVCGLMSLAKAVLVSASPTTASQTPAGDSKRTVLITGANRGIGFEFARQYHSAGWNVIATARDPEEAKELKALGEGVRVVALDVTKADSVAAMVKALDKQPIDLLINNAGVGAGSTKKFEELKAEDFEKIMQVNTLGPIRVTQALMPNLRAGNGKTIVSISSRLGSITTNTSGGYYGYRESKAALDMFMRSIGAELKAEGFTCIAMSPGWVKTDMGGPNAELTPEQSITGMRKVIDSLKPEDTGTFKNYAGEELPW